MTLSVAQEIINYTLLTYHKVASGFDETRKVIDWPILKEWAESLPKDTRIADIGCGSGRLLRYLKDKQVQYIGVDPVKELLDRAKASAQSLGVINSQFLMGDLLNVPLRDQSQDVVFCVAALHHIPSAELRSAACKELCRILKPGGRLFLTTWNLWRSEYRWLVFDTLLRKLWLKKYVTKLDRKLEWNDVWVPWRIAKTNETLYRYYHAFTKRELKTLLRNAGFRVDLIATDGSDGKYSRKGWNWIVEAIRTP